MGVLVPVAKKLSWASVGSVSLLGSIFMCQNGVKSASAWVIVLNLGTVLQSQNTNCRTFQPELLSKAYRTVPLFFLLKTDYKPNNTSVKSLDPVSRNVNVPLKFHVHLKK